MKVKDINQYEEFKLNNSDYYAAKILSYAERWADMMEDAIIKGSKIEDIAHELSHKADIEGITGQMHSISVSILANYWLYGEDLKVWYNKKYNYRGEDTVNPSIIKINI